MQIWTRSRMIASAAGLALLGGSGALADEPVSDIEAPLHSAKTLLRLKENSGVTLQWISWEERGHVIVREQNDTVYLSGGQIDPNGPGALWLDGEVISSGEDHFIFEGMIRIANTPDTASISTNGLENARAVRIRSSFFTTSALMTSNRSTDSCSPQFTLTARKPWTDSVATRSSPSCA